jgi:hypothetical protein
LEVELDARESAVQYLRTLTDKELAEVFYAAVRDRPSSDIPAANRHFVLADASVEGERWSLDVIALEDPAAYPNGWAGDPPVCQWGKCQGCGSQVRSWAKHMLCPICGSKAYGS